MRKKITLLTIQMCLLTFITATAQGPNETGTYYKSIHGKKGAALKTALYQIIKSPSVLTYNDLWEAYKISDVRDTDGKETIWDMYSNVTEYALDCDHKNNYEGSGINREHSMPKSWFNPTDRGSGGSGSLTYKDIKPMYSDLMHVIPTDGYINNMRSDMPYGEVSSITKSSKNDFSKVGPCAIEGYSGKVFEPDDEYKGDLARIYFYMITCYEPLAGTWTSDMFDATSEDGYQPFAAWVMPMLMKWAHDDPVSDKERDRNEAVYMLQGNRNPFVDYEGLEDYVWGDYYDIAVSYDGVTDGDTPIELTPAVSTTITLNNSGFGIDWSGNASKNTRNYMDRFPITQEKDGVSVIWNYGTEGGNMYSNTSQIRLYKYNTLTFRTEKNDITSIEFTVPKSGNASSKEFFASTGEMTNDITNNKYTWAGNTKEVTFWVTEGNGHIQLTQATVGITEEETGIDDIRTTTTEGDDHIYTLGGVRVDGGSLKPGIYIWKGKKIVIK